MQRYSKWNKDKKYLLAIIVFSAILIGNSDKKIKDGKTIVNAFENRQILTHKTCIVMDY